MPAIAQRSVRPALLRSLLSGARNALGLDLTLGGIELPQHTRIHAARRARQIEIRTPDERHAYAGSAQHHDGLGTFGATPP